MTTEPISISNLIAGFAATLVALAAILWPERLSPELQAAIIASANAGILLAATVWARARSTPTQAPVLPVDTAVTTPEGDAAVVRLPNGV